MFASDEGNLYAALNMFLLSLLFISIFRNSLFSSKMSETPQI